VKLTTHLHLVLRSENEWSYTSIPQYAFKAWCPVKRSTETTLITIIIIIRIIIIIIIIIIRKKRCGYEVPGMILLQASYLYTHSLLRGITFQALPLGSHALGRMMLPLLETFLNSCCGTAFSAVVTFFLTSSIP
jgi:hypothetical protein